MTRIFPSFASAPARDSIEAPTIVRYRARIIAISLVFGTYEFLAVLFVPAVEILIKLLILKVAIDSASLAFRPMLKFKKHRFSNFP